VATKHDRSVARFVEQVVWHFVHADLDAASASSSQAELYAGSAKR
jgi:hypothetical protein